MTRTALTNGMSGLNFRTALNDNFTELYTCNHIRAISSSNQAVSNASNAQIITYDSVPDYQGITCVNGGAASLSRFVCPLAGDYYLQYTLAANCSGNQSGYFWVRQGGADIASSGLLVPLSSSLANITRGIIFDIVTPNDYVELWMGGSSTTVQLTATAAGATPTRPACPSVVVNLFWLGS